MAPLVLGGYAIGKAEEVLYPALVEPVVRHERVEEPVHAEAPLATKRPIAPCHTPKAVTYCEPTVM